MEYVTYCETRALRDQYLMSRQSIIERIVFRNVLSNVRAYFAIRRTCERFIVKGNVKNLSWVHFHCADVNEYELSRCCVHRIDENNSV